MRLTVIREARPEDLEEIHVVVNDGASAYKGVIPDDRWHEPYMSMEELLAAIEDRIKFSVFTEGSRILGVMGVQEKGEVTLIRHAYVRTDERRRGIGSRLLEHLRRDSNKPILIGTWKAATWAIDFYEGHGFKMVADEETQRLLEKYWNVPRRQIETSVVLADERYFNVRHALLAGG